MDVNDSDRGAALMVDVLEDRYGLIVGMVEPVHMGTDTINRWVLTEDGRPLFVKEYRPTADLAAARRAWNMSEYCRAARIPVPRVWPDADGDLVTIAEGCAWAVTDEVPGRVATTAMTVPLAEHIGVVMGACTGRSPPTRYRSKCSTHAGGPPPWKTAWPGAPVSWPSRSDMGTPISIS